MKQLFAYIRVSTTKQGQGVSLQEQRATIERYAVRHDATITQWFEETKSAAKVGRPEFVRMVKLLRRGKADGVVMHKIDRSARNFRDWADIDDVISSGIDVFFANEDIDLRSRGGRLVADMQMVVAVDYIRNLREETLKGIHGRLKQGILPQNAPFGYLNCGAGKPKAIDPVRGPLIRRLFELYATGELTLRDLTAQADRLGLRNANNRPLQMSQVHRLLRKKFYAGLLVSKRFGVFTGAHEPIVSQALFDRVAEILSGKKTRQVKVHAYRFRRLIRCKTCHRSLIASAAKGHVYYRCATTSCPTTCLREEDIEHAVTTLLGAITLSEGETDLIRATCLASRANAAEVATKRRVALAEALSAATARLQRLTSLLVDGAIDTDAYRESRDALTIERHQLKTELATADVQQTAIRERTKQVTELARNPASLYSSGTDDTKRRLLKIVTSNCEATGKSLEFALRQPFATIANQNRSATCGPFYDESRTEGENRTCPISPSEFIELVAQIPPELLAAFEEARQNQAYSV